MTGWAADWFVGAVSIVLGVLALLAGALNWERAFQLPKVQWLEGRLGRGRARLTLTALGAALIVLGVAIAMGFAPNAGAR